MNNFIQQLILKRSEIFSLLIEHIELTLIAVLIAVVIGVPLGIIITKNKKIANIVIGFCKFNTSYTKLSYFRLFNTFNRYRISTCYNYGCFIFYATNIKKYLYRNY